MQGVSTRCDIEREAPLLLSLLLGFTVAATTMLAAASVGVAVTPLYPVEAVDVAAAVRQRQR